ncbi:maleylacetoacetate isomerase [Qipengyuania sp. JC766]|uniref:maleylacetoacetate isomerase n=1 Tax=Qipengyuania sp. JC766 TaxID=3232139 RepID=UPI00345B02B1
MRLHGYYRSSTSYRLRCALELKGLEYENCPVNLLESAQKDEAFTSRNPFGSVPMLETDSGDLAQSMAIIEWLDEAYPDRPLLPSDTGDRYVARELAYAIATELHAPLNLPVLKYLKSEYGQSQEQIGEWYRHWLARTLDPLETRLEQRDTGDFLFDAPGFFETVLLPQMYNARRFDFDFTDHPRMVRVEQACLALEPFRRAHPDNQPDNPEKATR